MYCHSKADGFVVSQLLSVRRATICSKLGSTPG